MRELLRRAPVDALQAHESRPALRVEGVRDRVGVAAEFRERAVAEAEHGERDLAFEPGEPFEERIRRGRSAAVAVGRGEDDEPLGAQMGRPEGVHVGDVDAAPLRR